MVTADLQAPKSSVQVQFEAVSDHK